MPAPQVALRPFCAHVLGGVGNASPQTLFLQRTPQSQKGSNKVGGGRQAYATRSLNNFNFRPKKIFFLVSELFVCGILFILLGNCKLIRMTIKFSEKFHIMPNELYRQLLTFWTVRNKKPKHTHTHTHTHTRLCFKGEDDK